MIGNWCGPVLRLNAVHDLAEASGLGALDPTTPTR